MKKPPMTQTQVGMILILVLLIGMFVASIVAGIVAMTGLHALPGRIA